MTNPDSNDDLKAYIRTIPDYPIPGILFRDITTLLLDGHAFRTAIDRLADHYTHAGVELVAGLEARGFVVASALAYRLGAGALLVRKPNKLPGARIGVDYSLEYGVDRLEVHSDSCDKHSRVLIADDLIATGGTAVAATRLLREAGAEIIGAAFLVDLPDLGGSDKLRALDVPLHSLMTFPGH